MARAMKKSGVEWIGEIPVSWDVVRFKDVLVKKKEICKSYTNEDIISLTMKGVIVRDLINPTGKMPATFDGYQYVEKGNLLLCLFDIDVTPRCVGVVKNNGLTSPAYSRYILRNQKSLEYYNYLLTYLDDKKILLSFAKSLRNTLTDEYFGAVKTLLPPVYEQQKIASFLDEKTAHIDSIITKTKESIEAFKAYKQALITETVTKGLNPDVKMKDSGIEWIGEIPEHWRTSKINRLFSINAGGDVKPEFYSDVLDDTHKYPVYTNSKDRDNVYAYTSNAIFPADSLTVTGRGDIGRAFYRKEPFDAIIRLLVLVPKDRDLVDSRYSAHFINDVLTFNEGSSAIGQLSTQQISPYVMTVPTLCEQQQIAAFLDEQTAHIDSLIANKEKMVQELEVYKKAMIYEYVTGKKEVE